MPVQPGLIFHRDLYEGQLASGQFDTFFRGTYEEFTNTDTVTLPQGRWVIRDPANPGGIILPTAAAIAAGSEYIGIIAPIGFDEKGLAGSTDDLGVPVGRPATILIRGIIGMIAETDLARGADIYIRNEDEVAPTDPEARGRIRDDDSGGNAALLPAGRALLTKDVLAGDVVGLIIDVPPTVF